MSPSQPLVIHDSLHELTKRIALIEPPDPQKRIGANQTIVFAVKKLQHNPKYEVLDEADLAYWMGLRQGVVDLLSDDDNDNHHDDQPMDESIHLSDDSVEFLDSPRVVAKGRVDELVIKEEMSDHYTSSSDREDEPDEISKNLKKIRHGQQQESKSTSGDQQVSANESPSKPEFRNKHKHRPKHFGLHCSLSSGTTNNPEASWKSKPSNQATSSPIKPLATHQPHIVDLNREPDWEVISNVLNSPNFTCTLKYLTNFKDRLRGNTKARTVLKDFILKCIQEDETNELIGALELVFQVGLTDDIDYLSELVKRFKRKLFWQTSTIPNYKVKTNPELTYRNYKDAMLYFSEHAKDTNTTFRLTVSDMLFLIDPIKVCQQNRSNLTRPPTPPLSTPESMSSTMCKSLLSSTPIKISTSADSSPGSGPSCKPLVSISPTSNVNKQPSTDYKLLKIETEPLDKVDERLPLRKVSQCTSASGKIAFKVQCRKRVIKT